MKAPAAMWPSYFGQWSWCPENGIEAMLRPPALRSKVQPNNMSDHINYFDQPLR